MSLRRTLILGLLLAAAAAYILKLETAQAPGPRFAGMFSRDWWRQVQELVIENSSGSFSLRRTTEPAVLGGGWLQDDLTGVRADQRRLLELFKALPLLQQAELVSAQGSDSVEYGLAAAALKLRLSGPPTGLELRLGDRSEYLRGRFAAVAGEPAVYLISEPIFSAAAVARSEIWDRAPLRNLRPLSRCSINRGGSELVIETDASGQLLLQPGAGAAEPEALTALRQGLQGLQARQYVVSDPAAAAALQQPDLRLRLGFADYAETLQVDFSKPLAAAGAEIRYLQVQGFAVIYEVFEDGVKQVPQTAAELRLRHPFNFEPAAVEKVVISHQGLGFSVAPGTTPGEWWVDGAPADAPFVEQLFKNLRELKAVEFAEAAPDLEPARLIVRVTLAEPDKREVVLRVGDRVKSNQQGAASYIAAGGDLSGPFIITEESFKRIALRKEALTLPSQEP